jgi:hypothetical protein
MAVSTSHQAAVIQALNTAEPATRTTTSPYDHLHYAEEHVHTASYCYPTLANGVTVTGAAGAWTLGAFVEIVPASTITSEFDIHYVSVEALSANDVYELHLFYGAGDTFAGSIRFVKNAAVDAVVNAPFMTELIPANSRIRAKLATKGGGSDTADISIVYHTY